VGVGDGDDVGGGDGGGTAASVHESEGSSAGGSGGVYASAASILFGGERTQREEAGVAAAASPDMSTHERGRRANRHVPQAALHRTRSTSKLATSNSPDLFSSGSGARRTEEHPSKNCRPVDRIICKLPSELVNDFRNDRSVGGQILTRLDDSSPGQGDSWSASDDCGGWLSIGRNNFSD
jgi:hypothetical protein